MAETTHDESYRRGVAKEFRRVFREYKKLDDLPPVERIGWVAGFALGEDDAVNESSKLAVRSAIERRDWQALIDLRSWQVTEDNLSYYVVQCGGRIHGLVEVYDRYDFVFRDRILWHYRCDLEDTKNIVPVVSSWEYLINPDPNPSLFARFLGFIDWQR